MNEAIKLGISSCLLGNPVRYDGGHKLDHFIKETLGRYVQFVPVCPEVECGLPVPRESMRLVGDVQNPRLVTTRSGIDHTERMQQWVRQRLDLLADEDLCGFIFKKDSPSSGMWRVKVYNSGGMPSKTGSGLFAAAFSKRFPRIPVEEEGRLHDPKLRENFIENIFALRRWRASLASGKRQGNLVAFHTREKLLLMAHSPNHYRQLGKLVAEGKAKPVDALYDGYEGLFLEALSLKTTPAKNVNVLQHLLGYFKKQLDAAEKQEMLEIISRYRQGHVPLIVPITLINHYVRKYDQSYLAGQTYLNPHPIDLQLRNHT
ncbi:YbgA family protein [Desulfatitalea alkaliphila]|uniref:DUF523 and DUF1722 domain-containing protein n=1 Tax=Desulfatitalea alkaliphila TaxID=2929485 RepID=A0AA41UHV3_9BACT|nr:DUF523 and DUF1722 domain-containing protein [Desulfatitalea alkaliphila]MCJ8500040.1 DUF523 and DUF1722 domain-containing protein [Desulfatitalea alkaliphila]